MQGNTHQPAKSTWQESWGVMLIRYVWRHGGIRVSMGVMFVLLAWDVVLTGSFCMSYLFCPIWFLVSILKNAIQRPGWWLALVRIAMPPLILAMVLTNDSFQRKNANEKALRIIAACEAFHTAEGRYPKTLDELVPKYLKSIPRAKYCLDGEFRYWNMEGRPMLMWCVIPPYYRKHFDFSEQRWGYLD